MDDLRNIWQNQEVEEMKIPIAELRAKAVKFQRRVQWRNVLEQAAAVFVIAALGTSFFMTTAIVPRISYVLIVAAACYAAWQLRVRGASKPVPSDMVGASCLEFHRRELEKQRDLLRNIWKWYLGPMVPGLALLVIWSIAAAPPARRWFPIAYAAVAALCFWGIGRLNRRGAVRLDRQIAELKLYSTQDGLDPRG
jgi:hypothetical protein